MENDSPINPPIMKHINWQKMRKATSIDNFLPLKFSKIVPDMVNP